MNMRFQLYSLACLLMAFFGSATAQNSCFQYTGDAGGFGLSVETFATDGVSGMTTYRVYVTTPNTTDFVSAVIGGSDTIVHQFHLALLSGRLGRHDARISQPVVLFGSGIREFSV